MQSLQLYHQPNRLKKKEKPEKNFRPGVNFLKASITFGPTTGQIVDIQERGFNSFNYQLMKQTKFDSKDPSSYI